MLATPAPPAGAEGAAVPDGEPDAEGDSEASSEVVEGAPVLTVALRDGEAVVKMTVVLPAGVLGRTAVTVAVSTADEGMITVEAVTVAVGVGTCYMLVKRTIE
jgi:hypothetical protein